MFNEAHLTLSGFVAGDPHYRTVGNNIPRLTLRVVWTTRRRDAGTGEWVDGNTSGVNVICWRKLADNAAMSLRRGDAVLVRGKLEVRPYVGKDGQRRTAVDVDAVQVGPDLSRGVANFRRATAGTGKTAAEIAAGENGDSRDALSGGENGEFADEAAALAALAEEGPAPGAGGPDGTDDPSDDDMFDDSAIEALAQQADSVTTPL